MTSVLTCTKRYFNRWRLLLLIFLLFYATILLWDLGYAAVQWDEAPHLMDGLLLSRGQLERYIQVGSRYPPLFDVITALYFKLFGVSAFSARFVAVTFSVLSVWAIFEFAHSFYGLRTALVSSVLLASMTGFIWLSRIALLETMLIFFFILSMYLFFHGINKNNNKMLILGGVTLGLGALVKYPALVGGIILLVSGVLLWRNRLRANFGRYLFVLVIALSIVVPWVFFRFGRAQDWVYVIQVGNEHALAYSQRFPLPIFYFIAMVYPVHTISIPIYLLALLGLGLLLWRRKKEDKFLLIWFFVVYAFFTLITGKSWRYVTPVFPVLAVSAAEFIFFLWDKIKHSLEAFQTRLQKTKLTKVVAIFFMFLAMAPVLYYSSQDSYQWVTQGHFQVPVEDASQFVADLSESDDTIIILCSSILFHTATVQFYLEKHHANYRAAYPYPDLPVDGYIVSFNVTELIQLCEDSSVEFLMMYQTGDMHFYESELTSRKVYEEMNATNRFSLEAEFGDSPHKVFVFSFVS